MAIMHIFRQFFVLLISFNLEIQSEKNSYKCVQTIIEIPMYKYAVLPNSVVQYNLVHT